MSTIAINGTNLELNLMDADIMEKFEGLSAEIVEKVSDKKQYEGLSNSEGMKLQCKFVDEFFDKLFGVGTAERLFNGNHDLGMRLEAFAAVSTSASRGASETINKISDKYGASRLQNREQKRHGKKKYNNRGNYGRR